MATSRLLHVDDPSWLSILGDLPHDAYQLPAYASVDAARTGATPVAFVHSDGARAVLVPLLLRDVPGTPFRDALSPYGYGGPAANTDDPAFWAESLAGFREQLLKVRVICCLLRLHPLLPDVRHHLQACGTLVDHGETVTITLLQTPEEVEASYRTNHRRDIRRANATGVLRVVFDDWTTLPDFENMYHETMDRVGASAEYRFPNHYLSDLRNRLEGVVHLATVLKDGLPVSGGVLLECNGLLAYHLGATRDHALRSGAAKLLHHQIWRWGMERGDLTYHLGGGLGGRSDDSLFSFKAGFSHDRRTFSTARLVLDAGAYAALSHERGALDLTGYFPAYRADGQVSAHETSVPEGESAEESRWPVHTP